MTLNKAQFEQFVENYVSHIIEGLDVDSMQSMLYDLLVREYEDLSGLDVDSMQSMLYDLLVREYEDLSEEYILNEIEQHYGEEVAQDLLESATTVPVE